MWIVKAEAGRLRRVLISNTWYSTSLAIPTLSYWPVSRNIIPEKYREAWEMLPRLLEEEGVKCYEQNALIREVVEKASLKEKKEIISTVWERKDPWDRPPKPNDLRWEHIVYGYPHIPYYDEKKEEVIFPDFNEASIYARDPSFMTQIGFVLSKNCYGQTANRKTKMLRVIHKYNSEWNKNIKIIYDAAAETEFDERVEGGDDIVCDEETIAHGCGNMSNLSGSLAWMRAMFERDKDEVIKQIVLVSMPTGRFKYTFSHLDTTFNWVDKGKAVVMPYAHTSRLSDALPKERKLLLKLIEGRRAEFERKFMPVDNLPDLSTIRFIGSCLVYRRGPDGKPMRASKEDSFVDWLIGEGKLDRDGIISVAGDPSKHENEVMYLIRAWQEQNRDAPNICQVRPGMIVTYDVNPYTLEAMREHGITVKQLPSIYLDMGGGPHCMTCPLERDPLP
jgi:N-dimethylarginine dimethylaminohydrolase